LWLTNEPENARQWWRRGLESAGHLLGGDWIEFYGNARAPLVFPMNDAVEIADRGTACAQALSITHRPTPATRTLLHAISQQSLRSAVRQQSVDLAAARAESGNLRNEFERVCQELEAQSGEKAAVEALSLEYLSRIHALEARLEETDAALNRTKELAVQRLEQIHALEARLADTDAGLELAKQLSFERLDRIQQLEEGIERRAKPDS
jgi:hypothetical protein